MHDGWTDCGTHYVGIFAVYNRKTSYINNRMFMTRQEVVSPLLSMAPMAKLCNCNASSCSCEEEATSFDAETHAQHILRTFELYNVPFETWTVCQITDNCSLNGSVADTLSIPLVN